MKFLKPMLPTLVTEIPKGPNWLYEVKYDGFRAMIYVSENKTMIVSRNQHVLNRQFPEIVEYFDHIPDNLAPLIFDGELCVLESNLKANFEFIQKRGRLKNEDKIKQAKKHTPVTFLAFDLLMINGSLIAKRPLKERKKLLETFFKEIAQSDQDISFQIVIPYENETELWDNVKKANGEGIVAKQIESQWQEGQRTRQWLKIKNLSIASFFIMGYDDTNAFFHIGCMYEGEIKMIGKVGQGFSKQEKEALIDVVKKNSVQKKQSIFYVEPSICIEVEFLEMSKNELRHPVFRRFRFDKHWEDCIWQAIPNYPQH